MLGSTLFQVTEWEWFKLKVRLRVLETNGEWFQTRYEFRGNQQGSLFRDFQEAEVSCMFWCKTTDDLLERKAPKGEHLEYYPGWWESEEQCLSDTLSELPHLSKEFDFKKHVVYTVLHQYGMGSALVCQFYSGKIHWRMSAESIPD